MYEEFRLIPGVIHLLVNEVSEVVTYNVHATDILSALNRQTDKIDMILHVDKLEEIKRDQRVWKIDLKTPTRIEHD